MPSHIRLFLTLPLALWFLITLLVLSTAPAYAEWVDVSSGESYGGFTMYTDPNTIRRKGELVKMWQLHDYKTVQTEASHSFLSLKAQSEFDCAEERVRLLAVTGFSGNMGKGNVVWSRQFDAEGGWHPVAPESLGQSVWKLACGKQ
jgi:surface-adhesin protein E